MTLDEWAERWKLSDQAIAELRGITWNYADPGEGCSEAAVASECRLIYGNHGIIAMRNNVGVLEDKNGRPVRYGLCNETPAMNKVMKSSDDILIIPKIITKKDVGRRLGIFGGAEYKRSNWVFSGKGREGPQSNFHRMLENVGAVGFFASSGASVIDTLVSRELLSS